MCIYILVMNMWKTKLEYSTIYQFSSVQSLSRVWFFVTPGLQHTRFPCASPSPGAYSNSWWLSRWCHPTISSSVVLFSSCLQPFQASESFLMSQLFTSGGKVLELQLKNVYKIQKPRMTKAVRKNSNNITSLN